MYGPISFLAYVDDHELDAGSRTPKYISIDFVSDLVWELRERDTMVLRLGRATDGRGTQFALVRADESIREFFLVDSEVFEEAKARGYESDVDDERMLGFRALPNLSETSLVNLGLASGVMSEALDIDHRKSLLPPATGRSTFTFPLRPHSRLDAELEHRKGQVEVDTLFAEHRNGTRVLFVIEAKTGTSLGSIANHKLVYPTLAVADNVPAEVDIIPVYLRVVDHVVECSFPDPRDEPAALNELRATQYTKYVLNH